MKKLYLIIIGISLSVSFLSCDNNFEEVNEDPNRLAEISPATILNPIIYGLASHNADRSWAVNFDLMQVTLPFPSVSGGLHRYDVSLGVGNSSYYWYYRWANNINEMQEAADEDENPNYQAIGLTLHAMAYANLTDMFGPVPMTEASSGEQGTFYPRFDSQQVVYETILADLERANELYDTGRTMEYASDILYQNDVSLWQKFTNALHMRLLLRISNRTETNAFQKLAAMINNPAKYPVFENMGESAVLDITGVAPNVSPWGRPQDFRLGVKMSEFFVDNLNNWDDPRRPIVATTADSSDINIGYKGIPSAYAGPESQFGFDASTLNIDQVTDPMQIFFLTYAEVEFIKAEVAQRGFTNDAQLHYENGVRGAMEQLGAVLPEGYFDNAAAGYDGTLARIMLQKYYALYFVDYQQWFEYRRTGLPKLPTTEAMFNDKKMPSRFFYPTDVQISNTANYKAALELLGGPDHINTKVWWDTVD
ncbi:SusD/RagB family nutrient-binding outer membrane lipoprotein [Flavimarina sp. Hel_I_48]|uniref:SusD/RagB family nutrient-binding outer membrane lipoprotein n=1 Tax=Flavimarina sp. Hel_I_48 TaxID=1392488 RepID=UPI0004DF5F69|nr:SusD/RagB family nutrient-binding outer membrane lipoprotein [Flavimarina sp. Hel_I_48]